MYYFAHDCTYEAQWVHFLIQKKHEENEFSERFEECLVSLRQKKKNN